MNNTITVIGGGISGITTALTLQLLGYETVCYAEHIVDEEAPNDPRFASLYPAASVIPHSVHGNFLKILFSDSLAVFETLFEANYPSVVKHRHYEIYEFPVDEPAYTSLLTNYASVKDIPVNKIPHRSDAGLLHGWAFDCFIAEWPAYIQRLYEIYKNIGGTLQIHKIDPADIGTLSSDVIINCTGVWSSGLFEDTADTKIIRGHLVHVPDKPKVRDTDGRICSYNYTPLPSVYATPGGEPCDVYFYPIGNRWLLGGSRQEGSLNDYGKWHGKESNDMMTVSGKEIPSQIIDLNAAILKNSYQTKIPDRETMKSYIGYRFERGDNENGIRLEPSKEYGKTIIHNYGHGGAGVTLSWGCALQVARILQDEMNRVTSYKELTSILVNELQKLA